MEYVVIVQSHDDGNVVVVYGPFDEHEAAAIFAGGLDVEDQGCGAVIRKLVNVP